MELVRYRFFYAVSDYLSKPQYNCICTIDRIKGLSRTLCEFTVIFDSSISKFCLPYATLTHNSNLLIINTDFFNYTIYINMKHIYNYKIMNNSLMNESRV